MGKKYLIISLSTQYGKKISEKVANQLGLYFLNIDEYVQYSLFDSENMIEVCGKDYYLQKESGAIKSCLEFENVLFNCSYDIFSNNEKIFLKKVEIIYLALTKNELKKFDDYDTLINQIGFLDRDKFLRKNSFVAQADLQNEEEYVNNIVNIIRTKI